MASNVKRLAEAVKIATAFFLTFTPQLGTSKRKTTMTNQKRRGREDGAGLGASLGVAVGVIIGTGQMDMALSVALMGAIGTGIGALFDVLKRKN